MRKKLKITGLIHRRSAFSLIEMLVVISIIALILAILLPALSASRRLAQNLQCVARMREIGFEFRDFADDFTARTRGDSDDYGPNAFKIEDFVDSMYRIDEFWVDAPPAPLLQYESDRERMMCAAGPKTLFRRYKVTAFQHAVWPLENVSLAVNRRLFRDGIRPGIKIVTSKILNHPDVPLLLDVDGAAAVNADQEPFYIAPPTEVEDAYQGGGYWFPSFRHGNKLNVAFVGGHVASSRTPLQEPTWRWAYRPD